MTQNLISYDPSNGEKLGEVQRATAATMKEAISKAKEAAVLWRKVPLKERLRTFEQAYSAAETSVNNLAELLSREMGKDIRRSTGEVQGSIWGGPYIAHSACEAFASRKAGESTIEYGPLGVAAIISPIPFKFPIKCTAIF